MNSSPDKIYHLKANTNTSFKIDYEAELNPQQLRAVITTKGPVLCVAGAGSGKTRTLIFRVSRLIESGVTPERILLLTFTKKAAQEMMRRAATLLDDRCKRIKGGTFHGFANYILRKYHAEAGLAKNFTICDRGDAEDLVNLVRSQTLPNKNDSRFPKKNTILSIYSKSINTSKTFAQIIDQDYPQFSEHISELEKLQEEYQKYKRSKNILDYDDLLVELKMLLLCNKGLCSYLSKEFQYIMIDEYQDTNSIQSEIGFLLASEHNNILAVGDDAQSIYSFRGANFKNIMDFPKHFAHCEIIPLEQNYRSTEPILNFANAILDSAQEKYPKKLFSSLDSAQKPVFIKPLTVSEQATFICQKIIELREEGIDLNQVGVLFRAAWHSNELEVELNARNLPFVKFGGIKFTEASHVKDLLSFARILNNHQDSVSWLRILLLIEGIGAKSAQEITSRVSLADSSLNALSDYAKKKYGKDLITLKDELLEIRKKENFPQKQLDMLLKVYFPFMKLKYDDYIRRIDDLNSLVQMSERYSTLENFLDDLSLDIPELTQDGAEATSKENEYLTLSTIHSAKGLEWHTVFLISVIDGFLPSSRSLGTEEEIEEERRLFYVACTRAKNNLFILCPEHNRGRSFSPNYSGVAFSEPSRFLGQINNLSDLIEIWHLRDENPEW
jgi:DNA helicase-2/ATP-dependent DNA helicase PcrA